MTSSRESESGVRPTLACCKCEGKMEEGFLPGYANSILRWVAGRPEYNHFGTLKRADVWENQVLAYRCSRCGYIEMYA